MNLASSRLRVATFAIIAGVVVQADTELAWWRTTTLYEIWPRSFKDSNGDGIGDLNGITSKLDYLSDLGIGAIWIAPCFSSPQADTGYDVSNYRDIDPLYGTMEDMDALIARATELGIKVILDYVPNHTSIEHEWFKLSEAKVNPFTDYYVWHEGILDANGTRKPPNNWLSRFNSGSAWEWSDKRQAYYFHQFNKEQPDLDFRNEAVIQESLDILTFWMDRGVAGFRIDALPFLFEDPQFRDEPLSGLGRYAPHEYFYLDHIYTKDLMEIYDLVARWRKHFDEYIAKHPGLERVMFTESYANISMISLFYDYGVNFPFNFFLIGNRTTSYTLKTQTAANLKSIIDEWMEYTPAGQTPNWVIGNHDRSRVASRFGSEKIDTFNILLLFLPGVPTIYNGEEIGMVNTFLTWEESEDPKACNTDPTRYMATSRDPQRTPFQWDNTTSAGFSTNTSVYLKVNENYRTLNLAAQREADKSYFKNFQAATRLRNTTVGKLGNLTTRVIDDVVLAFSRELDGYDPLLIVINWSNSTVTVSLDEFSSFSENLQVLLMSVHSNAAVGDIVSRSSITLEGHANLVLTTADATCSDYSTTSEIGCVIPVVRSLLKRVDQSRLRSWIYRYFFKRAPFCILNIICVLE